MCEVTKARVPGVQAVCSIYISPDVPYRRDGRPV